MWGGGNSLQGNTTLIDTVTNSGSMGAANQYTITIPQITIASANVEAYKYIYMRAEGYLTTNAGKATAITHVYVDCEKSLFYLNLEKCTKNKYKTSDISIESFIISQPIVYGICMVHNTDTSYNPWKSEITHSTGFYTTSTKGAPSEGHTVQSSTGNYPSYNYREAIKGLRFDSNGDIIISSGQIAMLQCNDSQGSAHTTIIDYSAGTTKIYGVN